MSDSPRDIASLTGIRGVAALAVVAHHACIWAGKPVVVRGQWAVDLFFVLSGFVISLAYLGGSGVKFRRFYAARFARIYPLYLLAGLATAVALFAQGVEHGRPPWGLFSVGNIVRELTLTTAMPVVGSGQIWNDPSWSISVESWTYLIIFPLLARWGSRFSTAVVAMIVLLALVALAVHLSAAADALAVRGWVAFARAGLGFVAGWAAYRLYRERGVRLPASVGDLTGAVCGATIVVYGFAQADPWWLLPLFPFVVLGLTNEASLGARILGARAFVWLGDISYSVYLVHTVALLVVRYGLLRLGLVDRLAAWIIGTGALTIAVSIITYRFIERPVRHYLRLLLDPKDRPEPVMAKASF